VRTTSEWALLATEGVTDAPAMVLASLGALAAGWRRLADLELAGRTMVTFMKGHMAEIGQTMPYVEYFRTYYSDMAAEFVQADDDGFVTHHCARTLFGVWQDELERLAVGPLGVALALRRRTLLTRKSAVRPGRPPLAVSWWAEVAAAMGGDAPQLSELSGNSVLTHEACVLQERPDLLWAQFLLWSTQTWARQVVVMWQVLRETIALRRTIEEHLDAVIIEGVVASTPNACRTAVDDLDSAYHEWRTTHAENVDIHDSIPRGEIYGAIGQWLAGLGPVSATWTIKAPMKTEMYREAAVALAALRGRPMPVSLPRSHYWRRTPWTPTCLRVGAPDMPPFEPVPAGGVR
jgi:hypothetical protein